MNSLYSERAASHHSVDFTHPLRSYGHLPHDVATDRLQNLVLRRLFEANGRHKLQVIRSLNRLSVKEDDLSAHSVRMYPHRSGNVDMDTILGCASTC